MRVSSFPFGVFLTAALARRSGLVAGHNRRLRIARCDARRCVAIARSAAGLREQLRPGALHGVFRFVSGSAARDTTGRQQSMVAVFALRLHSRQRRPARCATGLRNCCRRRSSWPGWKVAEAFGGGAEHSGALARHAQVRDVARTESRVHSRVVAPAQAGVRARERGAAAPLLFADPANTRCTANTFYAEWTALISPVRFLRTDIAVRRQAADAAALCPAGVRQPRARYQQGAAPGFAAGRGRDGPADRAGCARVRGDGKVSRSWLAGVLAVAIQVVQLGRATPVIDNMKIANAADVALTALLPATSNPAQTAAKHGLDPKSLARIAAATRGNCRTTTPKRRVPASRISAAARNCWCCCASRRPHCGSA